MRSNLVDLDGAIEAETELAVLFHTGIKEDAAWLPRSQIEISETGFGGVVRATMPEWLAEDKGLI